MKTQIRRALGALLIAWALLLGLHLTLSRHTSVRADALPSRPLTPAQPATEPQPIYHPDGTIDIGPVLRHKSFPLDTFGVASLAPQLMDLRAEYGVGDLRMLAALDFVNGKWFVTPYRVRLISDTVEIWVQEDLHYRTPDGRLNPIHPDARDPQHLTDARITALATAFEQVIRPTVVEYFGDYDRHDGSRATFAEEAPDLNLPAGYYAGPGERVIILVSNVRDQNYYDPVNNPSWIAGFYWPVLNTWTDRNVITIRSKRWDRAVGAPNYLYEGTLTHEFQHLINDDWDDNEEGWVDEGRSEFAEFIAGYRPTSASHRTFFSDFPENALTWWGDQDSDPDQGFEILADYQMAYWFFLYLAGRLREAGIGVENGQFLKDVSQTTTDPASGVASIDGMLATVAAPFRFREVWRDFRTAMLAGGTSDDTAWGAYISQWPAPSGVPVAPLDLGRLRRNLSFEGYDQPGAPPDGSDYIEIGWSPAITRGTTLHFDGDTNAPSTRWQVVQADSAGITPTGAVSGHVLFSGHTDLVDHFLIFSTTVPASGNQTLAFDTLYNIESEWDMGFVQVTTDTVGAQGFTSLPISGTTTVTHTDAHPLVKANVPGFSGVSGKEGAPTWVHVTHDLRAYAGQKVLLAFRYSTDWGAAGQVEAPPAAGWYLDNIQVGDTPLYSDETTVPAGAMSIWQARHKAHRFQLDVATFPDNDGIAVSAVFTTALDLAGDGTFPLGHLLDEPGFDEAGERVIALVSAVPPTPDADVIDALPRRYGAYTLTGLPPSLYTSRARVLGSAAGSSLIRPQVYPGDLITVVVTVDNLGRNADLVAAPGAAYVAVPLPGTTLVSGTLGSDVAPANAQYTDNLHSLDRGLPAPPGIYWHGTVSRTAEISFTLRVAGALQTCPAGVRADDCPAETRIFKYAFIANGPFYADPSQAFADLEQPVVVRSPLAFSTATGQPTVRIGGTASFTYTLVNTDDATRDVDFRFAIPAGTTLEKLKVNLRELGAGPALAQDDRFGLELSVPSFVKTGLTTVVVIQLQVTPAFRGTRLNPMAQVLQPGSDIPYVALELDVPAGATTVLRRVHLPLVIR